MAIPSQYSYITNIVNIYGYDKPLLDWNGYGSFDLNWRINVGGRSVIPVINDYEHRLRAYSYVGSDFSHQHESNAQYGTVQINAVFDFIRIDVDTSGTKVQVRYSDMSNPKANTQIWRSDYGASISGYSMNWISVMSGDTTTGSFDSIGTLYTDSQFDTLQEAIEYIYRHYANIDLYVDGERWVKVSPVVNITSNGGGATHIAKVTGQLKDLSSNLSDILMVSGGGGGGLLLGDSGWHGTEEDLIWSGNNNKMTVLKDGNDIKFKFYTNGTAIYTVTSQLADVSKIYVSFLADSENQVMKPSFIYETASGVYSYNQEEPTDEQMGDLYTWLSAGLPSE